MSCYPVRQTCVTARRARRPWHPAHCHQHDTRLKVGKTSRFSDGVQVPTPRQRDVIMTTPAQSADGRSQRGDAPADRSEHIAVVAGEGQHFADAARRGPWEAPVAGCPGWNLRDLVRHLSEIHLWAAANIARRPGAKLDLDDRSDLIEPWPDLAVFWPGDDELIDHYLRTNANLVRALESAPPDLDAPTFLPAPLPAGDVGQATGPRDVGPPLRRRERHGHRHGDSTQCSPPTGSPSCCTGSMTASVDPRAGSSRSRGTGRCTSMPRTPMTTGT